VTDRLATRLRALIPGLPYQPATDWQAVAHDRADRLAHAIARAEAAAARAGQAEVRALAAETAIATARDEWAAEIDRLTTRLAQNGAAADSWQRRARVYEAANARVRIAATGHRGCTCRHDVGLFDHDKGCPGRLLVAAEILALTEDPRQVDVDLRNHANDAYRAPVDEDVAAIDQPEHRHIRPGEPLLELQQDVAAQGETVARLVGEGEPARLVDDEGDHPASVAQVCDRTQFCASTTLSGVTWDCTGCGWGRSGLRDLAAARHDHARMQVALAAGLVPSYYLPAELLRASLEDQRRLKPIHGHDPEATS
jgi:hypothetical protein